MVKEAIIREIYRTVCLITAGVQDYAAFCHAKYYAKDNFSFLPADNDEDHRLLRDFLKKNGRVEIARYLTQLRKWRNESDYDDPAYNATPQKVQSALDIAEKVVTSLK
jgi:hypothetical protein